MWFFLAQYKKVIALCIIPIIAVVTLIGFEVIPGKGNRSEALAVNMEMRALLDGGGKQTATPSPAGGKTADEKLGNGETTIHIEDPPAKLSPDKTAVQTAKPKAAPKIKAASKPKESQILNSKVNINNASMEELIKLKGIGESKAKAIIAYRAGHSFQTVDELMKVKGIGPKIFEKIKDQLEL